MLNGLASGFVCWRYRDAGAKPGRAVLFLALGISILLNSSEAIGVIGAIWAMISLNEAAEEINEAAENKHFAPLQAVMTVISIALAVMLLFDFVLKRITLLYERRIRPVIFKNKR